MFPVGTLGFRAQCPAQSTKSQIVPAKSAAYPSSTGGDHPIEKDLPTKPSDASYTNPSEQVLAMFYQMILNNPESDHEGFIRGLADTFIKNGSVQEQEKSTDQVVEYLTGKFQEFKEKLPVQSNTI